MNTHIDSVLTVVTLFLLGLVSPGPNFLVVVQSTLNCGRLAGFVTGLGAATGDALYAACGLFGVAKLIETSGRVMMTIKFLGGLYLIWTGMQMLLRRAAKRQYHSSPSRTHNSLIRHYARGLATDLANPKTIVFFASIFAVTVRPETPGVVRVTMLVGIILTSITWRFLLSVVFATALIRAAYQRSQRYVERVFGVILCLFGAHLLKRAGSS